MRLAGILGGAGPVATADLYRAVLAHCERAGAPARPALLIASMRIDLAVETELLRSGNGAEQYRDDLLAAGHALHLAGADFLAMPCNTLHGFVPDLQREVGLPVLSIIDAVAARVRAGGWRRAGLLATLCTTNSGIYTEGLERAGIAVLTPDAEAQNGLHELILAEVHQQDCRDRQHHLADLLAELTADGAEVIVAGCTELQALLHGLSPAVPVVDSLTTLSEAVAREILNGDQLLHSDHTRT